MVSRTMWQDPPAKTTVVQLPPLDLAPRCERCNHHVAVSTEGVTFCHECRKLGTCTDLPDDDMPILDKLQLCDDCREPLVVGESGLIFCRCEMPPLDKSALDDALTLEAEDIAREHGELMSEIGDALRRWQAIDASAEGAENRLRHYRNLQRGHLRDLSAEAIELLSDAGCCWISDTLYTVSVDGSGAILLSRACPVRV